MNLLERVLAAGMTEDLPGFLKRKVFPTNLICLLLIFGIAIPFTIISLIYFDFLFLYPAVGAAVCVGLIFWNFNGGLYYTRYILSLVPILLGSIYNAYLSNDGEQPLPALYLIELSFTMIPFVIFDLKEKWSMAWLSSICGLLIITFPITNNWFISTIDSTVLRSGWLSSLTIALAIICAIGCILGLALLNKKAEEEALIALDDARNKAELLQEKEKTLQDNFKNLEEKTLFVSRVNYSNEGIAKVSEILRESGESQEVYPKVINTLVKHLKSFQAIFYKVDATIANQVKFKIAATYAYDSIDQDDLTPEDSGILGQAYRENRTIYITDFPEAFLNINSGLGRYKPTSVVIVPVISNGRIEGIMEMAFFNKLLPSDIEFLEKVGNILAAHIYTNRINAETQRLLEKSQTQSEELMAQEEELRQNMEEIEAINEASFRKVEEYEKQIESLKNELQKSWPKSA